MPHIQQRREFKVKSIRVLLSIAVLLGIAAPLNAADAGVGAMVIGFAGGAVWTSQSTGICIWYFPVLSGETKSSLFAADTADVPVVDMYHAYLLWVSDFSVDPLPVPAGKLYALALVPKGSGTIYYRSDPTNRSFANLNDRSTWGTPVATFVRNASIIRSPDAWASDTFVFSADLVSSEPYGVKHQPQRFDFGKLIPNGITCYEYGQAGSTWEAGVCMAKGK
jgi:hypothetical protein